MDLPTLKQALAGRNANLAGDNGVDNARDTEIIHAAKGEIVLPPISTLPPELVDVLRQAIKGGLEKRIVGHPATNKNPTSGLDAFFPGAGEADFGGAAEADFGGFGGGFGGFGGNAGEAPGSGSGAAPGGASGQGPGGVEGSPTDTGSAAAAFSGTGFGAVGSFGEVAGIDTGRDAAPPSSIGDALESVFNAFNPLATPTSNTAFNAAFNTAVSIAAPLSAVGLIGKGLNALGADTSATEGVTNPGIGASGNPGDGPVGDGGDGAAARSRTSGQREAQSKAREKNPVEKAITALRENPFAFYPTPVRRSAVHKAQPTKFAAQIIGARS